MKKWLAALAVAIVGVVALVAASVSVPAEAGTKSKCAGLDSGKIDVSGNHVTVTVTAPVGSLIDEYCVKAGSSHQGNGPENVIVNPAQQTVTFGHSSGKDVSHYSVSYTEIPTSTPTPTPTDTVTTSPTATVTNTPTPTATATASPTATATATPTSTPEIPTSTPTPSETPTSTPTSTATFTATPTRTPTFSSSATPAATNTATATSTKTASPTVTPTHTATVEPQTATAITLPDTGSGPGGYSALFFAAGVLTGSACALFAALGWAWLRRHRIHCD